MEENAKRLIIIDSNSLIHRAYHALPVLTTKNGELVNALYGFLLVFFRIIKELRPDFIAAVFDLPAPTFRHKKFKEYKGKRPPTPKELSQQIPKVKEILESFNVSVFEKEGFEADDIIGTLALRAAKFSICPLFRHSNFQFSKKENSETIIITGDLDTLQLADKNTKIYHLRKGVKDTILYDENSVKKKYEGLSPRQLPDFKALRGDPSDNIPGVRGIGEKTGIKLIKEFGSLEALYSEIEQESQRAKKLKPALRELLEKYKDRAFLSKELSQIDTNAPINFDLEKCRWSGYNKEKIALIFKNLEFDSLIKRLPELEKERDKNSSSLSPCQDSAGNKNLTLW